MKRLAIFDFDQTLFRSPEHTDANKRYYEQETGVPWHLTRDMAARYSKSLGRPISSRSGWWGRGETLMPPLVPDPAPQSMWIMETVSDLLLAKACPDTCTLIMTGRHAGLQNQVLRILKDGGFCSINKKSKNGGGWFYEWADADASLYLLGMDGPCPEIVGVKPTNTFPWKVWIIQQYRLVHEDLELIEIWEDRAEHVEQFSALNAEFQEKVVVHHVK